MERINIMDKFDRFIEKLQEQIFVDTKRAYAEIGFQRWRKLFHRGAMQRPDVHARNRSAFRS
jgi:hypothetical protein